MDLPAAASLVILAATLVVIALELANKTVAVLVGAVATVTLGLVKADYIFSFEGVVHWEALGLIFGMLVIIASLSESGFFRYIGLKVLNASRFGVFRIFVLLCALSAVMSAFMDSITVMFFLASMTLEIAKVLRIRALPFIIAEITSANIGGSATMVGDPPNIVIGTALHFSFTDFLLNTGPIAIVLWFVNIAILTIAFRRDLFHQRIEPRALERFYRYFQPSPSKAIKDGRLMRAALAALLLTIGLLLVHHILHISVGVIGILGATVMLVLRGNQAIDAMKRSEWPTLVFFAGLFVIVGGLEKTGVTSSVATALADVFGTSPTMGILALLWVSALFSASVDNVPFAATMVPVIREISVLADVPLPVLAWTTAIGCDVGGNATPIGASANVVALAVTEKHEDRISWREYCKYAFVSTVVCVLCASLLLLKYL